MIKHLARFVCLVFPRATKILNSFKGEMEKICPDRVTEKDPYLIILERVNSQLFEAYQHIVRGSEWCKLRPSLADEFEESSVPPSAPKVDPVSVVEGHGLSPTVKAKVLPLPLKARPKLPPVTQKRLRQEDVENASSPPSSTPSPPPPAKKLPPLLHHTQEVLELQKHHHWCRLSHLCRLLQPEHRVCQTPNLHHQLQFFLTHHHHHHLEFSVPGQKNLLTHHILIELMGRENLHIHLLDM